MQSSYRSNQMTCYVDMPGRYVLHPPPLDGYADPDPLTVEVTRGLIRVARELDPLR